MREKQTMPRKPATPGVDRRQQLLEAALPIFAEKGFEAATTKEITDQAGVNQGLIYFYFESKADIFFATFEHHAQLLLAQLDTIFEQEHDEDPARDLVRLLRQIMTTLDTPQGIGLLRIMHQIAGSGTPGGPLSEHAERRWRSLSSLWKHLTQRLSAYLTAQIAQGKLRPVNTGLAASVMARTIVFSIGQSQGKLPQVLPSTQEQAEMIVTLFCYGLLPREEQANPPR
jgi:AcrR family transcriptional regulator